MISPWRAAFCGSALVALLSLGCGGGANMSACRAPGSARVSEVAANTETYDRIVENTFLAAASEPRSTFSASVDTASYSNLRRFLLNGEKPPVDAVRIADMVNYFDYDYPEPKGNEPVGMKLELAACPWQPKHHLLRIALKAKTLDAEHMPPRNLVFLIDTSGSMNDATKLPLVQKSLHLLIEQLSNRDRVSIVTYAGSAGVVLSTTSGENKTRIRRAIDGLSANGSTNGEGGLKAAYAQAMNAYLDGGVNCVILATDGDFNVGPSSDSEMVRLIEEKRKSGVYLTVLGYGMGNLKDSKLEQIARHGNGHYAYIDSLDEARKVFVDQGGTLAVVAKDVKLQVEFNHRLVQAYRLIGYENRVMRTEQFRDDTADAAEMGSGHTCTALYEIIPHGVKFDGPTAGETVYQKSASTEAAARQEWLTVRMRYKHPDRETAEEISTALAEREWAEAPSADFRWAAAVTAFGMVLRDSPFKGQASLAMVKELAEATKGEDERRTEFLELVRKAKSLRKVDD